MSTPSTIYTFSLGIPNIEVEATSLKEAKKLAADKLDHLSGSNDGSEILSNAPLHFEGTYECRHIETRESSYNIERQTKGKTGWTKLHCVYTFCKRCKKELSLVETPR